jgi:hypothetical protein
MDFTLGKFKKFLKQNKTSLLQLSISQKLHIFWML